MSKYPPLWAILAPGKPSWVKKRAFATLGLQEGEEDEDGPPFELIRGNGRYHAILGLDEWRVGVEIPMAEALSLECDAPVYSIECANDPWTVMSWRHGALEVQEVDPGTLAKSLGCPLPGSDEPWVSPTKLWLRDAALVEGVRIPEVVRVLEEGWGRPLDPGHYHFEEKLRGVLVTDGKYELSSVYVDISERLPHTTVYGVTASSDLSTFYVKVLRAGECLGQFSRSPYEESGLLPPVNDIEGERTPERILEVLGIPAEWFLRT